MFNALALAQSGPPAAAIASAHPLATRAGHAMLDAGGNAFDAAVTVAAVLAVVEPYSSGLGGGGFFLLHRAEDGRQIFLDARERAPAAAHAALYLDENGEVEPKASIDGARAAAIPGLPAALEHLARRYGRLPWSQTLAPAAQLAGQGFAVDAIYARLAGWRADALRAAPEAAAVFLHDGAAPPVGAKIRQPELARTLRMLGTQGANAFYTGEFAERLITGVRAAGGIWELKDLRDYRVVERAPVVGEYRGLRLIGAPPPSSGGIALITMLNILRGYALEQADAAQRAHLAIEAMRRAYRDRAEYLGDPDFIAVPVAMLTSPHYAAGLRAGMRLDHATPSASLAGIAAGLGAELAESTHTTHFSILDRAGNRVAATLSINYPFGSGFMPPGTGVLLNDEMDDFVAKPGAPNAYGLVGAAANAIAPGRRPLSSMSPTFLENEQLIAILGTPGGSRIITRVLHAVLDIAGGADAQAVVSRPRYHHQYLPDVVQYEPGALDAAALRDLRTRGHTLQALDEPYGNFQAILWYRDENRVQAAADPRGIGSAVVK